MMYDYFDSLETGLTAAINQGKSSPKKVYALELAKLGKRLFTEGGQVAWCGIVTPFDLLNAMGVTSCFVEFIGAMLASTGTGSSFINEGDRHGYSSDSCSYHRAVLGAVHKGVVPIPSFLIGTTNPCSGGLSVIENLAGHFKKKQFILHIPQDETGDNIKFLADQTRNLVSFITEITGKNLTTDSLQEMVLYTNETREILLDIYNLAKSKPSPVTNKELSNFGIVISLFLGTKAAVDVTSAYRKEFLSRVNAQKSGVPGEKYRLLWIQNRIQFKQNIEDYLANEFNACIVVDELNDITWDAIDPDDPFTGLARRSISIPFNGTVKNRIEHLKKLAVEYEVDGAINPCNWGCRQGTGARGLIESGLKEIGVPVLSLEVDCIDSQKFGEGQLRTRIEAFMEMIASNRL